MSEELDEQDYIDARAPEVFDQKEQDQLNVVVEEKEEEQDKQVDP